MVIMSDIFHVKWNRTDPPKVQINTALTWHTKNGQMYHHHLTVIVYNVSALFLCDSDIFVNNNIHFRYKIHEVENVFKPTLCCA